MVSLDYWANIRGKIMLTSPIGTTGLFRSTPYRAVSALDQMASVHWKDSSRARRTLQRLQTISMQCVLFIFLRKLDPDAPHIGAVLWELDSR
jgi:hypothetical protein